MKKQNDILYATALLFAIAPTCLAAAADAPAKTALPKIKVAADGRTFVTADGKPFVPMGINYYRPGTGWAPQLWKQFDADATRKDFARMKAMGVNCVRVFISHGSFFMQPDALMDDGLKKFDQLLSFAEENGIYIHPTGPDHWEGVPDWAKNDRVTDEKFVEKLETFWHLFAKRYRGRSVIFAYDLRNEPAVPWQNDGMRGQWNQWIEKQYGSAAKTAAAWGVAVDKIQIQWGKQPTPVGMGKKPAGRAELLDYQHFRESLADRWTQRQAAAIKSVDPDALVTVGYMQPSIPTTCGHFQGYTAFRPSRQAKFLDFTEMHFYPWMQGFKPQDVTRNLAFLESTVREAAVAGKPLVVAEFGYYGGGSMMLHKKLWPAVTEQQQAEWCRRLVETTRGFACGWLNWGLYDHPQAGDLSQRTGLLTVEGKTKAWGATFERLAAEMAGTRIAARQIGPRPTLDWDACLTDQAALNQFRKDYEKAFIERP
jgi:hypothetical protein